MSKPVDMTWLDAAPCIGHGELFFGHEWETPSGRRKRIAAAIEICRTCPLTVRCKAEADKRDEPTGIWGGESRDPQHGGARPRPRRGALWVVMGPLRHNALRESFALRQTATTERVTA